jgi:RNA polymerase sigma-70 factor, ECF subfamily
VAGVPVNRQRREVAVPAHEFEVFYQGTFRRLVGQLYVVTGDLAEAEDVVQEAFARASRRWATLRAYDVPEAWVRRVALNLAANGIRRHRSRVAALLRLGPPPPVPAVSEDTAAVAQALQSLPVSQRRVIALHYLLDLPIEQVAHELNMPVGTVKSRPARARRTLAKQLGEANVEEAKPKHA